MEKTLLLGWIGLLVAGWMHSAAVSASEALECSPATHVAIVNPSFEDNAIASPGGFTSAVNGWVVSPNSGKGTFRPNTSSYPDGPTDGINVAYINRGPNSLVQTLSENLQAGMTYVLRVDVGKRTDADLAGYVITLEADGVVLATGTSPTPADGQFVTSVTTYTVEAQHVGKPLTIRLDSTTPSGIIQVNFDNVRLTRSAVAAPVAIVNPSFEDNAIASPGGFTSAVDGWVVSPNSGKGTFRPDTSSYPDGPTDGINVAYINRGPNSLVQTLSENLQAGMTYILMVDVGKRTDADLADYVITLEADGVVLATGTSPAPADGQFVTSVTTYTVEAQHVGKPLTIRLDSTTPSGIIQVNFDHVELVKVTTLFCDGFESGDTSRWSESLP